MVQVVRPQSYPIQSQVGVRIYLLPSILKLPQLGFSAHQGFSPVGVLFVGGPTIAEGFHYRGPQLLYRSFDLVYAIIRLRHVVRLNSRLIASYYTPSMTLVR